MSTRTGLTIATSARGLHMTTAPWHHLRQGSALPDSHQDWVILTTSAPSSARYCHGCTRTSLIRKSFSTLPRSGRPLRIEPSPPHLRRDRTHPCHISTGIEHIPATSAPGPGFTPATSAPGLGTSPSHLRGIRHTPAKSAPGLGSPRVYQNIYTGTRFISATSALGLVASLPHLRLDFARSCNICHLSPAAT